MWIDAVCIDQQNDDEKAWQVGLMRTIFSKCQEGLLWIGDSSEQSDIWCTTNDKGCCVHSNERNFGRNFIELNCPHELGRCETSLESLESLRSEQLKCRWHGFRPRMSTLLHLIDMLRSDSHLYDILPVSHTIHNQDVPDRSCLEPLMALRAFMNRSWWTRRWTVQEAVLPPVSTLCWGEFRYSLDDLVLAADRLYTHSITCCSRFFTQLIHKLEALSCGEATVNALFNFQKHIHTLGLTKKRLCQSDIGINLMDCLYNFHERESKDPRDKIFSLLGLLPKHFRLAADYQATPEELYERVSLLLLSKYPDRSLSVLWRESEPKLATSTPSWVKDFNKETSASNRRARGELYDASNGEQVLIQESGNGVLSFLGTQVDVVSKLTPQSHVASTYALDQFSTFRIWAQFLHLDHRYGSSYIGGGTLMEAFTKTLTGDLHEMDPTFSEEEADRFTQSLLQENVEDELINASLAQELNTSAAGRRLFVTRNGLIGLGPDWMQRGDEVWVLFGGSVPFILRPVQDSGAQKGCGNIEIPYKYHVVIGDCYVHGIMFGEGVGDPSSEQLVFLI